MWLTILLNIILSLALFVRWSRWVAFAQPKEYRFDRLSLFLQTREGIWEVVRLFSPHDFSRTGFKRPRLTARSIFTLGMTAVGLLLTAALLNYYKITDIFTLIILNLFLPFIVITIALLPTKALQIYSQWLLKKAGKKMQVKKPLVIGITGSFGKTATKLLLAEVLKQRYTVFMPPNSYNTIISISKSVLQNYSDQEVAIIEYAAYKKFEIAKLAAQIKPSMAIITGLTEQHLGLFGTLQNIIIAKQELIHATPKDSSIYFANESAYKIVATAEKGERKIIDVTKANITGTLKENGTLRVRFGTEQINTKLVGEQYLDTIRTVWAVARDLHISQEQFIDALERFTPPKGFTAAYKLTNDTLVIDDGGTSNPAGFGAALKILEHVKGSKKILITSGIVDLGEKSEKIHSELAEAAKKVSDEVWYVGQSGKEEFKKICAQKYFDDEKTIVEKLQNVNSQCVLLIEGRMPGWFTKVLTKYKS